MCFQSNARSNEIKINGHKKNENFDLFLVFSLKLCKMIYFHGVLIEFDRLVLFR